MTYRDVVIWINAMFIIIQLVLLSNLSLYLIGAHAALILIITAFWREDSAKVKHKEPI